MQPFSRQEGDKSHECVFRNVTFSSLSTIYLLYFASLSTIYLLYFSSLSTIYLLYFGIVLMVWFFALQFIIVMEQDKRNVPIDWNIQLLSTIYPIIAKPTTLLSTPTLQIMTLKLYQYYHTVERVGKYTGQWILKDTIRNKYKMQIRSSVRKFYEQLLPFCDTQYI